MIDLISLVVLIGLTAYVLRASSQTGSVQKTTRKYVIDTSALMDGRIFGLKNIGIEAENWIVLDVVISELKKLADNKSRAFAAKRNRAVKALTLVSNLKADATSQQDQQLGADEVVLRRAKQTNAVLVSLDKNLINQARAEGVTVFNPDELRQQSAPAIHNGDLINVEIKAKAEKKGAALGLSEWGETVIIENGAKYIGSTRQATVTSIKASKLYRRIFTRL